MSAEITAFLAPGIHDGISPARYHADLLAASPSLSSSVAVDLIAKSPSHARLNHPRLAPPTDEAVDSTTASMTFGGLVHAILSGSPEEMFSFIVSPFENYKTAEARLWKEASIAAGKTPVKEADVTRAEQVVSAVRHQLDAMHLGYIFAEGRPEQTALWQFGDAWMRARFDRWIPERGEIWDIKTTGKSAHPEQVSKMIPAMNYDMRSEFYLLGAEAITGMPSKRGGLGYQFLFIETMPPFAVTPCYLDESFRARGRQRAQQAIRIWSECMATGVWPGYVTSTVQITAPGWVDYELDESENAISTGEKMT